MDYFRTNWPDATIPPKLHMLENHVSEFIRQWNVGLGFYGEQGGESIHSEFNRLHHNYCRMKSGKDRLMAMVKEHHVRVHPRARQLKPEIKRRKTVESKNK